MTSQVRRVEVELLRRGPRHNQLLSPLTDYLAMCGDQAGCVVHVPWEHEEVLHLLEDLRYRVSSADPTRRARHVLDRAGAGLASMLGSVPGLEGMLAGQVAGEADLIHLRLVESAAELAILPFELTRIPSASGTLAEHSLALIPDRPVCITRRVRGVRPATPWPTTPRILVVSGDDVPFADHLDVFGRVLEPWCPDAVRQVAGRPRHWRSAQLTVIERATLDEIRAAVAERHHTHVHVLAHGAGFDEDRSGRHGIALGDGEVTRGRDLALALTPPGRDLPAVVTLATCDSGAQGDIMTPGGSVAHELHAAGIPLVVASQFPISQAASVPFTEIFYGGQLAGEHPLVSLCEVRRQLATRFTDEHAWASVVVYESLPDDFDDRLDELHYWQTRRAQETALARLERLATSDDARSAMLATTGAPFPADFCSPKDDEHGSLLEVVSRASDCLPTRGPFAAECAGLRGAGAKRAAEVAYWLSEAPDASSDRRHRLLESCMLALESALDHYSDGLRMLLASDAGLQRKVTTHWIAGQVVLMRAILGLDIDPDLRGLARWSARVDLDHVDPVVRAWAIVSHIEQAVLELAITGPDAAVSERAFQQAHDLVRVAGDDSEHVMTTHRQMRRFVAWWGADRFVEAVGLGVTRPVGWSGDHGAIATASAVATVLAPARRRIGAAPARAVQPIAATPDRAPSEPSFADVARTGVFTVDMLPAKNGDCLFVTYGADDDPHHVLIDCGAPSVAEMAAERVRAAGRVELFVLTHIDADHISGAIPLFADPDVAARFGDVWFNGWNQLRAFLSVSQGDAFSDLLDRDDRPFTWNGTARADDPPPPIVTDGEDHPEVVLAGGLRLTVLSPTPSALGKLGRHWYAALDELDPRRAMLGRRPRPVPPARPSELDLEQLAASGPTRDSSVPNLSSIAVLAEYGGRAVLLTGDAHADVLTSSIVALQRRRGRDGEPLRLDALKLSHHGSANATTRELLEAIDCTNYLVPTDGSGFYHPDREAIARVIVHGGRAPTIHFNARSDLNEFWGDADLQARYHYTTVYPDDEGLLVTL
ncbi:MAG TPA: CHAT domain-containing protein [Ilumatobacter sp.]|nr:CHAT domain-containing protein [Ilumatobacter sp.]